MQYVGITFYWHIPSFLKVCGEGGGSTLPKNLDKPKKKGRKATFQNLENPYHWGRGQQLYFFTTISPCFFIFNSFFSCSPKSEWRGGQLHVVSFCLYENWSQKTLLRKIVGVLHVLVLYTYLKYDFSHFTIKALYFGGGWEIHITAFRPLFSIFVLSDSLKILKILKLNLEALILSLFP